MKSLLTALIVLFSTQAFAASFPLEALPRYDALAKRLKRAGWDPLTKAGHPSEVQCRVGDAGICVAKWINQYNEIIDIFLHDDPSSDRYYVLIRWQG